MPKIAHVKLKSISPYSQSRQHFTPKEEKESHDDYERRTWREKCHTDTDGNVVIPPMTFKRALERAAAMLSLSIPGKGTSKYTKHFLSGVLVTEPVSMNVKKEEIEGEWLSCSPRGRRGEMGVMRCFPVLREWTATVTYAILDDTITKAVFEQVVKESGNFVGIGRFRPDNGGYYGRFQVLDIKWEK